MQAIKQFFKTHPHAWWGAYLPVYLAMFFTIEHFITDNYWATQTVLDTYIPFCEWFIFPYVSWSPLLVVLGIYLPMLVVEPLLTYRFGRVQETMRKAVSKGLRITVGYALILFIVGCLREWLALGSVFGIQLSRSVLPMASMPAGGFIVLGVLCAVWRTLARKYKNYLTSEARGLMAVYRQKEGEPEDE